MHFRRILAVVTGLFTASSAALSAADLNRPNLVFIVADDHAEWAMGCSGHPNAKTPNMDRLAREGTRLTSCFTPTPVCSPSRVAILSSRYGTEAGILDWLNPNSEPKHGLNPNFAAWPRELVKAGYRTGLVGKWHLGLEPQFHPSQFGYQHFMGFLAGGTTPLDPELTVDGEKKKVSGYVVDLIVDDALKFLSQESLQPFALSVHFREPHQPYTPLPETEAKLFEGVDVAIPNPDFPKLDIEKVRQTTRDYLGSVAAVDRNVGRILDELDKLKLADNTIVIYTSDHGYNIGHHGIWHKGNGRWILTENPEGQPNIPAHLRPNVFDTSARVPALIRWPKQIAAGKVIDRTVTHLDWFPTILAATGAALPDNTKVHGQSILPLLTNTGTLDRSDDLYMEYSIQHTMKTDMRSYRTREWKLMKDFLNPGRDELYHLSVDPGETTNLANSDQDEAKSAYANLSNKIHDKMKELNDSLVRPANAQ